MTHALCDHAYDYCSQTVSNSFTAPRQTAAKLNLILDSIWRSGDRDECSIKHVGHALAALMAGKTWREGMDYFTPWGYPGTWTGDGFRDWTPKQIEAAEAKLAVKWEKVTRLRDEIGKRAFQDAVTASKYDFYATAYFVDYWTAND